MQNFLTPLPPFNQAPAAKNITSPIAIFDPCTHEKKFFPPSTKKVVPMCGEMSAPAMRIKPSNFSTCYESHSDGAARRRISRRTIISLRNFFCRDNLNRRIASEAKSGNFSLSFNRRSRRRRRERPTMSIMIVAMSAVLSAAAMAASAAAGAVKGGAGEYTDCLYVLVSPNGTSTKRQVAFC